MGLRSVEPPPINMDMLRRAHNVEITHDASPLNLGWLVLHVGGERRRVRRLHKAEYGALRRRSKYMPQWIVTEDGGWACWMYQGNFYWDNSKMSRYDVHDLLNQRVDDVPEDGYPKLRMIQGAGSR